MLNLRSALAAVAAITVTATGAVMLAAPGDITYIKAEPGCNKPPTILDSTQEPCLANWAKTVWPDIVPGKVDGVTCQRNRATIMCSAVERRVVPKDVFIKLDIAKKAVVRFNGCSLVYTNGNAEYCHIWGPQAITVPQRVAIRTCLEDIWAGTQDSTILSLTIQRDGKKITAEYQALVTRSQAIFLEDRICDKVIETLSEEQ